MSSTLIKQVPEAEAYASSTGTMQFQPDKPIPSALIKKLVQARIAQNLEIADERAAKRKTAKKVSAKASAKKSAPKKTKPKR
jgi:uncharacterized protein YdhG (YjbR/CyaY superfamily)